MGRLGPFLQNNQLGSIYIYLIDVMILIVLYVQICLVGVVYLLSCYNCVCTVYMCPYDWKIASFIKNMCI